jgi:putative hydrolase of the HAD superfamily
MKLFDAIYNRKTEIKNIIFDWGGVITDLHFDATKKAFQQMGIKIFHEDLLQNPKDELFIPFEIGHISPEEFRNGLRKFSTNHLPDTMIDDAWNSMLGDLPVERWRLLESARQNYRTFLLSNTNAIHIPYYFDYLMKTYGFYGYTHLFEKTYFSFELGLRKPNADIFEYVLNDTGINPNHTLFIDDFVDNIETARKLGFQVVHLKAPLTLTDVFVNGLD